MSQPPDPSIAVLLGTRPEAIKLAPLVLEFRRRSLPCIVVTTGQHRELVTSVLELFAIEPDLDLQIMRPGQTLDYIVSATITGVGAFLADRHPAAVLVQGDTSSALGAALAAFHHRIPVGHVEAGLRSGDIALPFPEEMNRRATAVIARWHFAPTEGAARNLALEGIRDGVTVTGNTIVDAVRHILDQDRALPEDLAGFVGEGPYLLATSHRRESWGGGIAHVAAALREVLDVEPDLRLVFAAHPNPLARGPVDAELANNPRVRIVDSLDYASFLVLLSGALIAVSDSGGVQEEGPTLGIPVVVTRSITERPEGVDAGVVQLVGTDQETVRRAVLNLLRDPSARHRMSSLGHTIYGDGLAAVRIADVLAASIWGRE
jgi:UDP-N-acetylglucosamine 2-epimerase (non-hydrolysing)